MEQATTTIHGGELNPLDSTGLCLLSLDGGGVRGLSTLYIMKGLMDRLNDERPGCPRIKPCEVFDLIGGTSTGGLIAIMLGRLEMDVDECIAAYTKLMEKVFEKPSHRLPMSLSLNTQSRFDAEKLESAINEVIINCGAKPSDLFNDGTNRGCRVFVCAVAYETKDIVRLRSYNVPGKRNIPATISQAARATSAASTFFDPVNIGARKFVDGGVLANNPVDEVEGEASDIWCSETGGLQPLVKCFISIGTGNPGKKAIEDKLFSFLSQTLVDLATETEHTETKFIARWRHLFDKKRYFRFNVAQGLQNVGLAEYREQGAIEAATDGYLDHQAEIFRVRDCVQNLKKKQRKFDSSFAHAITTFSIDQTKKKSFHVQFDLSTVPAVESFLGRDKELGHLWEYLRPLRSRSRKVAILHGLGGVGKTQLAIRFARDHTKDFTAIFWLSGKTREILQQSLSSVLPRLPGQTQPIKAMNEVEVEQNARQVLQWLSAEGNSHWLIIFDNIDQYSTFSSAVGDAYDISEFFPTADHGSILITTRLQSLTELGEPFPVDKLESNDAIQLLLQSSGLSAKNTMAELESNPDVLALASRLDGLPLAIVIAGSFMRETGTSITEYLQYYQESWSDLQLQSSPGRHYQQGNMLETWMISYCEIQKRDPSAAELLLLLACFDNRDIWYELVKGGSHGPNVPAWLKRAVSSGLTFKTSVKTLIGFSLIETKQQEGSYAMHPVVQDWCLHIAGTDNHIDLTQLNELALICVGRTVPSTSDQNYSELQRRLIPHANYVSHGDWRDNNIAVWEACLLLGNLYFDQGKLKEAEEMCWRALAGFEKAWGPDHRSTLTVLHNIGLLYKNQGKLKEAEEMYQRTLAGYEKALGPDHISTLHTVNNLGNLYSEQGKLKEAEEMYQHALAGYEKALGPDHRFTLTTVHNIGHLYSEQGKLKEAEEMYQRALAGKEKALGPDHTSTLDTVNNLGILYTEQGKLKEAEEMYQHALAGKEKALGPDHISTLDTVHNLGILYSEQGKLKEAEVIYQQALEGTEKALGPDHISTLHTVNKLGNLYSEQGKLKEAEEMYHRALAGYEKALGPDHTSALNMLPI